MRITSFSFYIKGDNDKKTKLVVEKLKELNIGHIRIYSGDLKKQKEMKFNSDGSGLIANTKMGKFIGLTRGNEISGEYVSEVKKLVVKEKRK